MFYSNDPLADFDRWEDKRQEVENRLPICDICGEPIQDEYLYDLDGEIVCVDCLINNYRKPVEDYMED